MLIYLTSIFRRRTLHTVTKYTFDPCNIAHLHFQNDRNIGGETRLLLIEKGCVNPFLLLAVDFEEWRNGERGIEIHVRTSEMMPTTSHRFVFDENIDKKKNPIEELERLYMQLSEIMAFALKKEREKGVDNATQ